MLGSAAGGSASVICLTSALSLDPSHARLHEQSSIEAKGWEVR
jgi:hypothetical protein